jgi:hypothetical protein
VESAFLTHLSEHLSLLGYPNSSLTDLRELAIRATNVGLRAIEARPRRLELPSPPFAVAADLQDGFNNLGVAVRNGDDLTPFQSKLRLNKADFHDQLLTDWGIHHFHLGSGQDPMDPRFMKRTGPVLYAFLTEDRFLALSIDEHGSWSDPQLLEVLHRNWPEVIAGSLVADQVLHALETEADIQAFRDSGINGVVRLSDGTLYRSHTLGQTSDKKSLNAVLSGIALVRQVKAIQKHLDNRFAKMRSTIVTKRNADPSTFRFKLAIVRGGADRKAGVYLDEETTGYSFVLRASPSRPACDASLVPGLSGIRKGE